MTERNQLLRFFATKLKRCVDDPDKFNTLFLKRSPYWERQKEVCQSVAEYRVTVVYSGNMVGKDYVVGGIPHWWLYTRPDSLVIVTGPTQTTLGTVTWKEIRRAANGAAIPMGSRVTLGAKSSPLQVEVDANGWGALGYSTTSVERASGQHAEHLLVVVEEASGVEDEIWDAIESLGYDRLLVIGNPIRAEGRFVDLIRQAERDIADGVPKHMAINAIRIQSTESPHAQLDKSPWGMADKTWLESVKRKYGEKSLWYKSHVLAEIPAVSADILIPGFHLDLAINHKRRGVAANHPVHATRRLSCDLGEGVGRDSSCILTRDDYGILGVEWGAALGLAEAAAIMHKHHQRYAVQPAMMSFDKLGIGKNFPNHLARYGLQNARPYGGSGRPMNPGMYTNIRTEAAWKLRQRLDPQHVPNIREPHQMQEQFHFCPGNYHQRLLDELKPLTYECIGNQVKLLNKDDWAEILGHSPDVADALIQSFSW